MRERKIEQRLTQAVEIALVLGEGYVVLGWDATKGKQYGIGPNGSPLFDGDLTALNFTPFQVVKDTTKNSSDEQDWYITHSKKNKYDLMARYPHLAGGHRQVPARRVEPVQPDVHGSFPDHRHDQLRLPGL
jgi:hypothetical protein